jgi:hypothetical protein
VKYFDYCLLFCPILDWNNNIDNIDSYEAPVILKINASAMPTRPAPPSQTLHAEFTWKEYREAAEHALHMTDTQIEMERDSFLRNVPVLVDHISRNTVFNELGFQTIG